MRKRKLLIVENGDDAAPDVSAWMDQTYQVQKAYSCMEASDMAVKDEPDLIIGNAAICNAGADSFCRKIKTDERIWHIPLIILAGNVSEQRQAEILKSGADLCLAAGSYSGELLLSYIHNMLSLKEALRRRYGKRIFAGPPDRSVIVADTSFIRELIQVIGEKMQDPDFSVEMLAAEMKLSKSQLYRRFSEGTKLSVGEFIRGLRLQKAAVLLLYSGKNVSEVAYEVGFRERKHFSREFKRLFGKSPVEFATDVPPGGNTIS
ncbi:response regulator transcription factor [Chitinophaga sp. 22321]|uniref:Helix-turn-helix domain-containing protein n=1 Tax=Chitinophaga hostae TaxID=2831022 RepID=A0ABS5J1K3_9BACT|nr:helix-turn-helix domain-containing protein [Chitinophaga hostae]MBS0028317.1 helix-turn-helix domain-containing protein [Chitinophaga hostae]